MTWPMALSILMHSLQKGKFCKRNAKFLEQLKYDYWPGAGAHSSYPSTLGGQGRQVAWAPEFEISLGNMVKPCFYIKYKKISQMWWYIPVVIATWEAKVGGSLEPQRQRLQCIEITPLHSSLGDTARPCLKKKNKKPKKSLEGIISA